MRSTIMFAALTGIAAAAPQAIDYAGVDAKPDPVFVSAPLDVVSNIPEAVNPPPITPITSPASKAKRAVSLTKRDGNCSPQPAGAGPVPSPDTADAFLADSGLSVHLLSIVDERMR